MKIILASTSPRRKELLSKTGLIFETKESGYDEEMHLQMSPEELSEHLSFNKAKAVFKNNKDAIVIAADTFVVFNGKYLGKPKTKEEARDMLNMLSGQEHEIITGVTVMSSNKTVSFNSKAKVYMKKLSAETIDNYIKTGEPLDKAGAYAIQEKGAVLIEKVDGDFFGAVGLPIGRLSEELKNFGINVL
ncbi:MAG: Maf family protein [Candidatus Paceibacterota bacterium]|jgi:septum formation protein